MNKEFAEHLKLGLTSKNKFVSSKYFYDDIGSSLFTEIMNLPEYYLTDCEYEVLDNYKNDILKDIKVNEEHFDLIELGAGDGQKTKLLLEHFVNSSIDFTYSPIDISSEAFIKLNENIFYLKDKLNVNYLEGDYFEILRKHNFKGGRKVILFLGSNIGNFKYENAKNFLKLISSNIQKGDILIAGFDLKKNPNVILKAYNDAKGVTKKFNLNLLQRINNEFKANFDLNNFEHFPVYDPEKKQCRSYIISLKKQEVNIKDLDLKINFDNAEAIFTELSQKYDEELIEDLAQYSGFEVSKYYYDERKYFSDVVLVKK